MLSSRQSVVVVLAAVLVVVALAPAGQALSTTHREWRRYDSAATGPTVGVEQATPFQTFRVGGVRLEPGAVDRVVNVQLLEDQGRRVAGRLLFTDATGAEVGRSDFCLETTAVIPSAARVLWVLPSELVVPCPLQGSGPAMSGTVYAEFRG